MAFTAIVPSTINVSARRGVGQKFKASNAVTDLTGTVVDLSAWTSLAAKLVAATPGPNTADVSVGTVTADAGGFVYLQIADTDLASANLGTANLVISGKPTSGDIAQLLSSGSFQLSAS
jgi:hypothetical protein